MALHNASISVTEFIIGGFETIRRPLLVGAVILIAYVLAILANITNILVIIYDRRLHKPMYLLICNLAVVDIVYTSSSCPTMIGVLLAGVNTISYVPCLIQMCVFHVAGAMEMFAIAIMAFDRLIAISYPFQYHSYLTNVRTLVLTYVLWIAACASVAVVPVTVIPLPHCSLKLKYSYCDFAAVIRTTCADPHMYFNIVTTIAFFLIFFTFTLICLSYFWIIIFVKVSSKTDKRKMGSTCLSHFIVVTCYYCPVFVRIVVTRFVVLTFETRVGLMIGSILGPPLVNPFVYFIMTKEMKYKLFKIFRKDETLK